MPSWAGQQQFPRSSIRLPLRHTVLSPPEERRGIGWTRNVSEGGACMEVAETLPLDAVVHLRFQTDRGAIEAEAVVVWAAAPAGGRGPTLHGVAFTRLASNQRQTLRALLQTPATTRHSGARFPVDLPVAYQVLPQAGPPGGVGSRMSAAGGCC
jgi:hypothetical protein